MKLKKKQSCEDLGEMHLCACMCVCEHSTEIHSIFDPKCSSYPKISDYDPHSLVNYIMEAFTQFRLKLALQEEIATAHVFADALNILDSPSRCILLTTKTPKSITTMDPMQLASLALWLP